MIDFIELTTSHFSCLLLPMKAYVNKRKVLLEIFTLFSINVYLDAVSFILKWDGNVHLEQHYRHIPETSHAFSFGSFVSPNSIYNILGCFYLEPSKNFPYILYECHLTFVLKLF